MALSPMFYIFKSITKIPIIGVIRDAHQVVTEMSAKVNVNVKMQVVVIHKLAIVYVPLDGRYVTFKHLLNKSHFIISF